MVQVCALSEEGKGFTAEVAEGPPSFATEDAATAGRQR
jgi:hypothetical protein